MKTPPGQKVFGGVYDAEFEEPTLQLFDKVKLGEIICIYSNLTIGELDNAPKRVRDFFAKLPAKNLEFVSITDESLDLALHYVDEKVVGQTSFDDCIHIALATIHKADILVSWNFKHIVNVYRIRGYNSVNLRQGYMAIEIRSPKDIVNMKTTKQVKEKEFDTVKTFNVIKEKISKDIYGMTLTQIQEYLQQQKIKTTNS